MLFALLAAHAAPDIRQQVIDVRGGRRGALVHVPSGVPKPRVVVAYHGFGGNAKAIVDAWLPLAEEHGLLLVVPVTRNANGWFAGRPPNYRALDLALFESWKDWAVEQGGDADRVYAAGFSMGAHFTSALLCRDVPLAGAAMVGMSMVQDMEQTCKARPTPIVYVASKGDRFAKKGPLNMGPQQVMLTSQKQTSARLAAIDGCGELGKPTKDRRLKTWEPKCSKAPLLVVQVPGSEHSLTPRGYPAAKRIWAFWEKHQAR